MEHRDNHYIVLPGSQRQRFFLASHHTAESMICDSRALMTKMGGFFLLMSIRPTSNVSNQDQNQIFIIRYETLVNKILEKKVCIKSEVN